MAGNGMEWTWIKEFYSYLFFSPLALSLLSLFAAFGLLLVVPLTGMGITNDEETRRDIITTALVCGMQGDGGLGYPYPPGLKPC